MSQSIGGRKLFDDGTQVVAIGASGQAHNRDLAAVAITTWASATNTVTFPAPGVTDITIIDNPLGTASVTGLKVCFDAPNDAVAQAWLTDTGSLTVDAPYTYMKNQDRVNYIFSTPITRLDFLAYGATHRVMVEAI